LERVAGREAESIAENQFGGRKRRRRRRSKEVEGGGVWIIVRGEESSGGGLRWICNEYYVYAISAISV